MLSVGIERLLGRCNVTTPEEAITSSRFRDAIDWRDHGFRSDAVLAQYHLERRAQPGSEQRSAVCQEASAIHGSGTGHRLRADGVAGAGRDPASDFRLRG